MSILLVGPYLKPFTKNLIKNTIEALRKWLIKWPHQWNFLGAAAYYIFNSTYVDCTFVATYLDTIPLTERAVG